jgi:hypothetical protein
VVFPTTLVQKIPREYSDHNPLILVIGNQFIGNHNLLILVQVQTALIEKLRFFAQG